MSINMDKVKQTMDHSLDVARGTDHWTHESDDMMAETIDMLLRELGLGTYADWVALNKSISEGGGTTPHTN